MVVTAAAVTTDGTLDGAAEASSSTPPAAPPARRSGAGGEASAAAGARARARKKDAAGSASAAPARPRKKAQEGPHSPPGEGRSPTASASAPVLTVPPPSTSVRPPPDTDPDPDPDPDLDPDFLAWCQQVLGIRTAGIEIRTFAYPDFLEERRVWDEHAELLGDWRAASGPLRGRSAAGDDASSSSWLPLPPPRPEDVPPLLVRGLGATRTIHPGELILSVPLNAMLSVRTTIDHDPVLAGPMGPERRKKYGWDGRDSGGGDLSPAYEVPLLVVALLHHVRLGVRSPLARYVTALTGTGGWSPEASAPWGPREAGNPAAAALREDVRDMYLSVVGQLVRDFPDLFGPTEGDGQAEDWAFSFERFRWAFSLVNSRHWNVPVRDWDGGNRTVAAAREEEEARDGATAAVSGKERHPLSSVGSDGGIEAPPASQPTDDFVKEQVREAHQGDPSSSRPPPAAATGTGTAASVTHSFLAPVADLLNFGPPCTRGLYDSVTHRFDVVATCTFRQGQEITFYYSDDCEDEMRANYGFVHPMIPPCPTIDVWRETADGWRIRAEEAGKSLAGAYAEAGGLEDEVETLESRLERCGCGDSDGGKDGGNNPSRDETNSKEDGGQRNSQEQRTTFAEMFGFPPPRRELRGTAQTDDGGGIGGKAGIEGAGQAEGHGGVRRPWRVGQRDNGESL